MKNSTLLTVSLFIVATTQITSNALGALRASVLAKHAASVPARIAALPTRTLIARQAVRRLPTRNIASQHQAPWGSYLIEDTGRGLAGSLVGSVAGTIAVGGASALICMPLEERKYREGVALGCKTGYKVGGLVGAAWVGGPVGIGAYGITLAGAALYKSCDSIPVV